ncbi:HAD-IIIC family phosphatase [Hyphococcus sp. DH-69]|uniref:HAD-IIIC family phosphatase n=1 Tax=Hyphococcus formosus TaxID=3143534 RepID=UPI00398AE6F6
MTSGTKDRLVVSATFTADLLNDVGSFLARDLGVPGGFDIAAYGQVYQQLLDPGSALRQNGDGANVLCIRWCDLTQTGKSKQDYLDAAHEIKRALGDFTHQVPCYVVICPQQGQEDFAKAASNQLAAAVETIPHVSIVAAVDIFRDFEVTKVFDIRGDKTAHIPYTEEAFAALGTFLFRQHHQRSKTPMKMVAVDCDNTLWCGVVGEDGVDGIVLDEGAIALQRRLVALSEAGVIVSLLSKNQENDVNAVFEKRADMVLQKAHILDQAINWNSKAENLAALASKYGVGHDAIVFLDDNPVECGEVSARMPAVRTVQFPHDRHLVPDFVNNLWALDHVANTSEDRNRIQMYRDNAAREEALQTSNSFAEFLAGLKLEVDIEPLNADTAKRIAQLTQRTNQFNINLRRLEIAQLERETDQLFSVSVRDRFGDYGIVGAMSGTARNDVFSVNLFLLSCRALGKGVEHKMLAFLAQTALEHGCKNLVVDFQQGPRNQPARVFLETVFQTPISDERPLQGDISELIGLTFSPSDSVRDIEVTGKAVSRNEGVIPAYQDIAEIFTTGANILAAMSARQRARPELSIPYISPSTKVETEIAAIWQEILRVQPVGINDEFQDLGGKSIHLVRIHSLLEERYGYKVDLVTLFAHSTIKKLADRINQESQFPLNVEFSAANRAVKMRAARNNNRRRLSRKEAV